MKARSDLSTGWYRAFAGAGVRLPGEQQWKEAFYPPLQEETAPLRPRQTPLTISEIQHLVETMGHGEDEEAEAAALTLANSRARAAIPPLCGLAADKKVKKLQRRGMAVLTVGQIGGLEAAVAIMGLKKNPVINPFISMALGLARHPSAVPYLLRIVKEGFGVSFQFEVTATEENMLNTQARAYALIALGMIGSHEAVAPLITDAASELLSLNYPDANNSGPSSFSTFGLLSWAIGKAITDSALRKRQARAIIALVEPDTPIEIIQLFPSDTQRIWMFHQRISVIEVLITLHGPQFLLDCLPRARNSLQRLMVVLPAINVGLIKDEWISILDEAARSKLGKAQRILAYFGYARLYTKSGNPGLLSRLTAALNEKDPTARAAAAAVILANNIEPLFNAVFAMFPSFSSDIRLGLVFVMFSSITRGGLSCQQFLETIRQNDPDKNVRVLISDLFEELPEWYVAYAGAQATLTTGLEEASQALAEISGLDQAEEDPPAPAASQSMAGADLPVTPTEEWICSDCQAVVPADSVRCPNCQAIFEEDEETALPLSAQVNEPSGLAQEWFCDKCQAIVPADAVRCPNCGAIFEEDEETSQPFLHPLALTLEPHVADEVWICMKCHAVVPSDAVTCPACQANLEEDEETAQPLSAQVNEPSGLAEEWFCDKCQAIVPADAVRCPICHADFEEDNETEQAALPLPAPLSVPVLPISPAFCTMCGGKVSGQWNYCPNCGSKVELKVQGEIDKKSVPEPK